MKNLILRNPQPPGDILMLSAAVRDLHRKYPGKFVTDVRTGSPAVWEHNPYLTKLEEGAAGVGVIDCHYPLIGRVNRAPYHFLHGFIDFLNTRLGLEIEPTEYKGDIHLSQREKAMPSQVAEVVGEDVPFWLVGAGGKFDFTIKWWDVPRYQEVVDHFRGRVLFVQVGAEGDHHPPLEGVLDLRGKTDLRQLIRLVHHAQGVLCPVTLLMHLAAAVETRPKRPKNRACVVVAGGREPMHWTAYPHHQFLHTGGVLKCCEQGGCWRSRTVPLGDGDGKDKPDQLCVDVVMYRGEERHSLGGGASGRLASPAEDVRYLPHCMDLITAADVIRRIELYFEGGQLDWLTSGQTQAVEAALGSKASITVPPQSNGRSLKPEEPEPKPAEPVLPEDQDTLGRQRRLLEACVAQKHAYPKRRFRGRGIVICGGGDKYFPCAWVCIHLLRHLGCQLPIELWYNGADEMNPRMREIVAPLNVRCVDALLLREQAGARPLRGWEIKPYAILHSRFREVLLLDADNVPVRNPEFLFQTAAYAKTGALFWPDIRKLGRHRPIWSICGIPYREEWEWESGQIVVDKKRCWKALQVAMHFNEESDFYYQHFLGDKESFHLAWRKLEQPCTLPSRAAEWRFDVLLQYDHEGNLLFQHRNGHKWRRGAENDRVPGFLHEARCLEYLAELDALLDQASSKVQCWIPSARSVREREAAATLLASEHKFRVADEHHRPVCFGSNGRLTRGLTPTETYWDVQEMEGRLRLGLSSAEAVTGHLWLEADGIWRGTTIGNGDRPLQLIPQPAKLGVAPLERRRRLSGNGSLNGHQPSTGHATERARKFQESFPRVIHLAGTEDECADCDLEALKAQWLALHPGWECRIWHEEEFAALPMFAGADSATVANGDWRRCAVAHACGGFSVSAACAPLKKLDPLLAMVAADAFVGVGPSSTWYDNPVAGSVIGALPDAPFLRRVAAALEQQKLPLPDPTALLTRLAANDERITVFPRHIFHPNHSERPLGFTAPSSPSASGPQAPAKRTVTPFTLQRCADAWQTTWEAKVLAAAKALGWSEVFPILTEAEVAAYEREASPQEKEEIERYFEVDQIINPRPSHHVLSTSLFWKHVDTWNPDLPPLTLDLLKNARKLGLVERFDPWSHYVQPLLRGAAKLARSHPHVTVRVYLASDLPFLVPMLAEHCEVRLMKHPSTRAQPGMLWRFLALEDAEFLASIIDSDALEHDAANIIRLSENLDSHGLGSWRQIAAREVDANGFFVYRPIIGSRFGTRVRIPIQRIVQAYSWRQMHSLNPKTLKHPTLGALPHFTQPWPGYALDEWFLATAIYPRLLPYGIGSTSAPDSTSYFSNVDVKFSKNINPAGVIVI